MTIRSHDQFNTTVYDVHDRYRGVHGDRHVVFLHPADLAERGLTDGQAIDLFSHSSEDGVTREARGFRAVAYDIPRGCAAAYFPETNVLVSKDSFAIGSRTPLSKFIPITIVAEEKGVGSLLSPASPVTEAVDDKRLPTPFSSHEG